LVPESDAGAGVVSRADLGADGEDDRRARWREDLAVDRETAAALAFAGDFERGLVGVLRDAGAPRVGFTERVDLGDLGGERFMLISGATAARR